MKLIITPVVFLLSLGSFAQETPRAVQTEQSAVPDFETYCRAHALQRISGEAAAKLSIQEISGELALKGTSADYREWNIELKENEAQYFRISGSDDLLKAESLFRLRLMYSLSQQKL